MGYACPVCTAPQRDAEHLANHLAFVAMLHGDDHEAWLDEHAPGWDEAGPEALGERVAPHAEPATYEEVFEDTVHDAGRGRPFARPAGAAGTRGTGAPDAGAGGMDERTRAVLAEARELTGRMYGEDGDRSDEREDGDGGGADDGADRDRAYEGTDRDEGDGEGTGGEADDGEEKA